MGSLKPTNLGELADALADTAGQGKSITVGGAFTKRRMTPRAASADVIISTTSLNRIVEYEPRDLTISVEAGIRFADLSRRIRRDGLMLPLDPPFFEATTVGGVVAANRSGPRRRFYGTARNLMIGATFVPVDGKPVHSGGMVVKNAAGLDMAKLLVGSFGTLAAIAVVNFRLAPIPPVTRTFVLGFDNPGAAFDACDALVRSPLQPVAIDWLNSRAAEHIGRKGYLVAVQAAGNEGVIERYSRELPAADTLEQQAEETFWESVREFTPRFLDREPGGAVVRVSSARTSLRAIAGEVDAPVVARAGSGVCYGHFSGCESAGEWMEEANRRGGHAVIEFLPESGCAGLDQWPAPGNDFKVMEKVKQLFDPRGLLNKGGLHDRL